MGREIKLVNKKGILVKGSFFCWINRPRMCIFLQSLIGQYAEKNEYIPSERKYLFFYLYRIRFHSIFVKVNDYYLYQINIEVNIAYLNLYSCY